MASIYLRQNIDIDVDEFMESCCSYEIDDVIDWLEVNGHLPETVHISEDKKNLMDIEWDKAIEKLHSNRTQLTVAEEEFIKTIANRL
jgi:hypothetical protein